MPLWFLDISPPKFSSSDNMTHTIGPSDNYTAIHLVLVTIGPSPNPKVDELFVKPKNEHLYPKILDQLSQCDRQLLSQEFWSTLIVTAGRKYF